MSDQQLQSVILNMKGMFEQFWEDLNEYCLNNGHIIEGNENQIRIALQSTSLGECASDIFDAIMEGIEEARNAFIEDDEE